MLIKVINFQCLLACYIHIIICLSIYWLANLFKRTVLYFLMRDSVCSRNQNSVGFCHLHHFCFLGLSNYLLLCLFNRLPGKEILDWRCGSDVEQLLIDLWEALGLISSITPPTFSIAFPTSFPDINLIKLIDIQRHSS